MDRGSLYVTVPISLNVISQAHLKVHSTFRCAYLMSFALDMALELIVVKFQIACLVHDILLIS